MNQDNSTSGSLAKEIDERIALQRERDKALPIPTPETMGFTKTHRTESEWIDFAISLERRLAVAVEALKDISVEILPGDSGVDVRIAAEALLRIEAMTN